MLALSGTLDAVTLKRLINCGCTGAFDKSSPAEIDALMDAIADHLAAANSAAFVSSRPRARVADTARAIAGLIRDWNRRIELEEHGDAQAGSEDAEPTSAHGPGAAAQDKVA